MASLAPIPPVDPATASPREARAPRAWVPRRVLLTRGAREWAHGRAMAERAAALGAEVVELPSDRVQYDFGDDQRRAYVEAKATLAVVVASAAKRRLQPIAPSADWRVDLAEGCPAHCQYCYLAGSLKGPPITRAYANVDEILAELPGYIGQGRITSRSRARAHEGTTFEASCYTDPLALEHITGSLARLVSWFGEGHGDAALRFTSKFSDVGSLLPLAHNGRTRMRVSLNARTATRFEGGTHSVPQRLGAMRRMVDAGYPVGLTIAPIIADGDWRAAYGALFGEVAAALEGARDVDLTAELITHRFSPSSKTVLNGWYPGSALEMDKEQRAQKRTKFGAVKHVYPAPLMKEMRGWFEAELGRVLPGARLLYWT